MIREAFRKRKRGDRSMEEMGVNNPLITSFMRTDGGMCVDLPLIGDGLLPLLRAMTAKKAFCE